MQNISAQPGETCYTLVVLCHNALSGTKPE